MDGIIVADSLGENSTLSFEEKLKLADWALKAVDKALPVLLTIAEGSGAEACRLCTEADKLAVDGYMVLPGMHYVADRIETLHHFG